jgi:hypothetical protein
MLKSPVGDAPGLPATGLAPVVLTLAPPVPPSGRFQVIGSSAMICAREKIVSGVVAPAPAAGELRIELPACETAIPLALPPPGAQPRTANQLPAGTSAAVFQTTVPPPTTLRRVRER